MSPQSVSLSLTVNGDPVEAAVEPRTHLADFLRGPLSLTGTHLGCEHGVCGACTVLIDGQPARSCITLAAACDGSEVRTVEGFGDDPTMRALRDAFSRHHGLQCGYCTPGMLISARDVVARFPGADETRVRREMSGNLCRCTGYMGIVAAVREVARRVAEGELPTAVPDTATLRGLPRTIAGATTAASAGVPARPTASATAMPSAAPLATPPAPAPDDWVEADESWPTIDQSFVVPHPPERVWPAFEDLRGLAACMPGAEITEIEGERVAGRFRVKFGPIRGAFEGSARHRPEPAALSGRLLGSGLDRASASRARGAVAYALKTEGDGTRVEVVVRYQLSGPLAQFGRSALVRDFAQRLAEEFARNLSARIEGGPDAAPARELNAITLTLSVLWTRLKRLFGG